MSLRYLILILILISVEELRVVKRFLRAAAALLRDLREHVLSAFASVLLVIEHLSIDLDRAASSHGTTAHCKKCWFHPILCQGCPRLNCFLGFVAVCVCVHVCMCERARECMSVFTRDLMRGCHNLEGEKGNCHAQIRQSSCRYTRH